MTRYGFQNPPREAAAAGFERRDVPIPVRCHHLVQEPVSLRPLLGIAVGLDEPRPILLAHHGLSAIDVPAPEMDAYDVVENRWKVAPVREGQLQL
jgi:hypothetical protein